MYSPVRKNSFAGIPAHIADLSPYRNFQGTSQCRTDLSHSLLHRRGPNWLGERKFSRRPPLAHPTPSPHIIERKQRKNSPGREQHGKNCREDSVKKAFMSTPSRKNLSCLPNRPCSSSDAVSLQQIAQAIQPPALNPACNNGLAQHAAIHSSPYRLQHFSPYSTARILRPYQVLIQSVLFNWTALDCTAEQPKSPRKASFPGKGVMTKPPSSRLPHMQCIVFDAICLQTFPQAHSLQKILYRERKI